MDIDKLSDLDRHVRQASDRAVADLAAGGEPASGDLALALAGGVTFGELTRRAADRLARRAEQQTSQQAEVAAEQAAEQAKVAAARAVEQAALQELGRRSDAATAVREGERARIAAAERERDAEMERRRRGQ
jgi:hypothetical protein